MPKDLRSFLQDLIAVRPGDVKRVSAPVDPRFGATAVAERFARANQYPALYFEQVGASRIPLVLNLTATYDRLAVALETTLQELVPAFGDRMTRPIASREVPREEAPVKAQVWRGGDVDLGMLPLLTHNELDGGPYITSGIGIMRDPESGRVNAGIYRHQVHSRNELGVWFIDTHHGAYIHRRYEERGQPAPIVIAIGHHPAVVMGAVCRIPGMGGEFDAAGALLGESLEVTRAETCDLPVPARAEIVIEGEVIPHGRRDEGPFGEYVGYIHGPREPRPVMRVHAITHRRNPMIPFTNEGTRDSVSTSTSVIASIIPAAMYFDLAYGAGLPVTGVAVPTIWPWSMIVISTAIPFPGYIHAVARKIFSVGVTVYPDFLCFVDADVDPTNAADVLEEIVLKAHPLNDFHGLGRYEGPKASLNVYMNNDERKRLLTSKVYIDATTKKWDSGRGPRRMNYESVYPQEVRQRAEQIIENLTAAKALV